MDAASAAVNTAGRVTSVVAVEHLAKRYGALRALDRSEEHTSELQSPS